MNKLGTMANNTPFIIAFVICLVVIGAFILIRVLKNKQKKAANNDNFTPGKPIIPQKEGKLYNCTCGFGTDTKLAFSGHLRSKGQHAPIEAKSQVVAAQPVIDNKPKGKYAALAFTANGIIFTTVDKRMGKPLYLDPSIPVHHGAHYLVRETAEGIYEQYDPREANFDASETPSRCYKATHVYDLIKALFANKYGLLDKINYLIMGLLIICSFFIILTLIDKVGK